MTFESGQFRHLPAAFKREFPDLPVLAVCRIDSLDLAAELVESKAADLVAMTRAHIADPDIISKYQAGRAHTIRSCIACNEGCVGRLELVNHLCEDPGWVGRSGGNCAALHGKPDVSGSWWWAAVRLDWPQPSPLLKPAGT